MDLLGFLDCLKYLRLLEPVIQGFFVGIKIDIQVVFYYAAALILHCIDNAVNEELRSQGELVQVGRDGVVFFGNCAGIGVQMTAAACFTAAVSGDLKGSIGSAGNGGLLRLCLCYL